MNSELQNQLQQLAGSGSLQHRADGIWIDAAELNVLALAELMRSIEARLITISALAIENNETELMYHFVAGSQAINVKTCTKLNTIASITAVYKAANWCERENHDLFSVDFTGHPNLTRLIRPPQLAKGFFRQPGGAAGKALRGEKDVV